MAWKLRRVLKGAPKGSGADVVAARLEEYEQQMRDALDEPMDDKRNNELTWPTFRLHYERNRYLYEQSRAKKIQSRLIDYLVKKEPGKYDRNLIARWKKPGYERLCSLSAITKSNTNFRTTSVCRTPLKHRTGQITPCVMTGCVSCASGDGGPIWWNDPVPDIVKNRILAIDPGKAALLENGNNDNASQKKADADAQPDESDESDESDSDEENEEILKRAQALKASMHPAPSNNDGDNNEDAKIMKRAAALKESDSRQKDEADEKLLMEQALALKELNAEKEDAEIMERVRALKQSEGEAAEEKLIQERAQALKEKETPNEPKTKEEHDAEIMKRACALRNNDAPTKSEEEEHDSEIIKRARALRGSSAASKSEEESHDAEIMKRARALRDNGGLSESEEALEDAGAERLAPPESGAAFGKRVHDDIEEEEVRKRPRADGKET